MIDLRCEIAGIESPNPFWLASAPPTDKYINVKRAFDAGWGGAVWKTVGIDPPVVNVTSRYGVHRDMVHDWPFHFTTELRRSARLRTSSRFEWRPPFACA